MGLSFLIIIAVIFFLPISIKNWKWFWITCGLIGTPLIIGWAQYFYANYNSSFSDTMGAGIFIIVTTALCFGMLGRYVRWLIEMKTAK